MLNPTDPSSDQALSAHELVKSMPTLYALPRSREISSGLSWSRFTAVAMSPTVLLPPRRSFLTRPTK